MSLRRAGLIALKELRHIARDRRMLLLVGFSPALLALCFSYVFSFDIERATLAVLDMDRTLLSRQYIEHITADGDFSVDWRLSALAEGELLLKRGVVDAVVVIPPGFASQLLGGKSARVQAMLDGSDTLEARLNSVYLNARTRDYGASLYPLSQASASLPLETRAQAWYNPSLKSLYSMVPGLVAVALQMPSIALALALSRERESGSFETLVTTPMRGAEYLLGKLLAYLGCGIVSALLVLAIAALWFGVPFRASVLQYIVLTSVFFLASMSLAMLPGNLAASQQSAMVIMLMIVFVPSFFLSGLLLPVDRGSGLAEISASILPATHFIHICRGLFLKGGPIAHLRSSIVALVVMGAILVCLNLLLFRKRA